MGRPFGSPQLLAAGLSPNCDGRRISLGPLRAFAEAVMDTDQLVGWS